MNKTPVWIKIVGSLSILPSLYFWLWVLGPKAWLASYPGKPGPLLIGVLCSIPVSVVVANRGSRIWYLVIALALGTLLFIGFRLH
jgi:hypothetical protein